MSPSLGTIDKSQDRQFFPEVHYKINLESAWLSDCVILKSTNEQATEKCNVTLQKRGLNLNIC